MRSSPPADSPRPLEDKFFLVLLVAVSAAFVWILLPFYGGIFWAVVIAIVFAPLNRRIERKLKPRRNLAALATLGIILLVVILPLAFLIASLVQEAGSFYAMTKADDFSVTQYFDKVIQVLPGWATDMLNNSGLGSLSAIEQRLSASFTRAGQVVAGQVLSIGQDAANFAVSFFIMVYVLFFLLRDGDALAKRIRDSIPLHPEQRTRLIRKLTTVIRATVKGNILVAIAQGTLGGIIFWILGIHAPVLWGVLMAFLSLVPAVGAALVWAPAALYLIATGAVGEGLGLIAYGVFVIGLVDNVLRPILVGQDTRMPDYVVLVSTLGGIAVFGLNGFVIGPLIAALNIAAWDIFSTSRAAEPQA